MMIGGVWDKSCLIVLNGNKKLLANIESCIDPILDLYQISKGGV